jgi:hypothetical protein
MQIIVSSASGSNGQGLGALLAFAPDGSGGTPFAPRGLRLTRDGRLCCVARDEAVAFDLTSGRFLGALLRFQNLYGQALDFFPTGTP